MSKKPSSIPAELFAVLQKHAPLLIALSGGQDSLVLLAAANSLAMPVTAAMIIVSEFSVPDEAERAAAMCRTFGVAWWPVKISLLEDALLRSNPVDRCYLCKRHIMRPLLALADEGGMYFLRLYAYRRFSDGAHRICCSAGTRCLQSFC